MSPKLAPSWSHVAPCWAKWPPRWPQVGAKLAPSWPQVGACWPKLVQLGQVGPKLAPRWPQVGSSWLLLAPSWPHDGPSFTVSPRLAKASTKALPLRLGFYEGSASGVAKACHGVHEGSASSQGVHEGFASKAWVFQDVREGSASGVATRHPRRLCL